MCSMYWNLRADWTCPKGHEIKGDQLQTHFMGDVESCQNEYVIGEPVKELGDLTGTLDREVFIGICDECDAVNADTSWYELGARIEDGKVMEVWTIQVP